MLGVWNWQFFYGVGIFLVQNWKWLKLGLNLDYFQPLNALKAEREKSKHGKVSKDCKFLKNLKWNAMVFPNAHMWESALSISEGGLWLPQGFQNQCISSLDRNLDSIFSISLKKKSKVFIPPLFFPRSLALCLQFLGNMSQGLLEDPSSPSQPENRFL